MTPTILNFIQRNLLPYLKSTDSVLELGSLEFNGSARSIIRPTVNSYTGVDKECGPGVDTVIKDDEDLKSIPSCCYDCVVCCETLEHTPNPWFITEQLKRLLKPNGLLLITTPTYGFPLHRYPIDCYRFGEDAYREFLFKNYNILHLETIYDFYGPYPIICGVGTK